MTKKDAKHYCFKTVAQLEALSNCVYNQAEKAKEYKDYERAKLLDSLFDKIVNQIQKIQTWYDKNIDSNTFLTSLNDNMYLRHNEFFYDHIWTDSEKEFEKIQVKLPIIKKSKK